MRGFVLDFCFPDFLFLAGSLGNSGFVHFGLLFLILRISPFSPFSRNSRSGWFVFCLVSSIMGVQRLQNIRLARGRAECSIAGFADNHLFSWTLRSLTSPSSPHTTAHHPPNHTLSPHDRTIPLFTQDLIPDTAVDIGGAAHARTSNT